MQTGVDTKQAGDAEEQFAFVKKKENGINL